MKPIYTTHAKEQMEKRRISEAEVEQALADFHTTYQDKKGNPIYIARVEGRRIKVVVTGESKGKPRPVVITCAD